MIRNYQSGSKKSVQEKRLCEKKKDEYCNKHVKKILGMKSVVIMQFNLIDYKELKQTAWGRSQHNNDKMRVVFAQGIKCRKDLVARDIASLNYALFAQSKRLTIREDSLYLHATHHAPSDCVSKGWTG